MSPGEEAVPGQRTRQFGCGAAPSRPARPLGAAGAEGASAAAAGGPVPTGGGVRRAGGKRRATLGTPPENGSQRSNYLTEAKFGDSSWPTCTGGDPSVHLSADRGGVRKAEEGKSLLGVRCTPSRTNQWLE